MIKEFIKEFNNFIYEPRFSVWYTVVSTIVCSSFVKGSITLLEFLVYIVGVAIFEVVFSPMLCKEVK